MFKIPWILYIIASVILLFIFLITSLMFSKKGTFSTMYESLLTPDIWLGKNMTVEESNKFESKGEKIARKCLQDIYGLPFKNVRLNDIKNPNTNKNLEIDCYNPDLKIGLEYHGQNHYKFIPFFHKTREEFEDSQKRDFWKSQMCNKLGIVLIIVPYNCKHEKICSYISTELKKYGKMDHILGWNASKNKND